MSQRRTKPRVSIVLTPEERELLDRLAAERQCSLSALVGQLGREEQARRARRR